MRMSALFGRTLRETPADIEHPPLRMMLRAGLARPTSGGITLLPLGVRVLRRLETIVREELTRIGAQEIYHPLFRPVTASDRVSESLAPALSTLECTDRSGRSLTFTPTDPTIIVGLATGEIASYRQLPVLLHTLYPAYRSDCRVSWLREGLAWTVYNLNSSTSEREETSARVRGAFERIFRRCNIQLTSVEAGFDEGNGSAARAYVAISGYGDTDLLICESCGYAAVQEAARTTFNSAPDASITGDQAAQPEEIATPDCATIADLARFCGVPESATAKAVFFDSPERGLIFAVIRGDREINAKKLCAIAGVSTLMPARPEQISAIGAVVGYASPVGLQNRASGCALIVADPSVTTGSPLIAGANRHGYHLRNVVYGRDWRADLIADIALARAGDPCPGCSASLRQATGLTTGYAERYSFVATDATFLDRGGIARPIVVSSSSLYLERLILTIIEQRCDHAGIIWTPETAPFDVHLIRLGKQDATRQAADALYDELTAAGVAVLYDDRDDTAGVKFNDADLIGLPLRLVLGDRFLSDGMVEIKQRATGATTRTPRQEIVAAVVRAVT